MSYADIEKYCRKCLELYVLSRARMRFFSKFTIITAIVGLCAFTLVEVAQALIFGLAHKIIEAELFLFGKSGLIVDFDFYLLQGVMIGLWIIALLSLICYIHEKYSPCIIMIFAFPLIAVYSAVAFITGQKSGAIYILMFAYSILMFVIQFITLHNVAVLEQLKKEPGYPNFNPQIIAQAKHYDDSQWNEMSDDEKIMAEREGYFRGR